MNTPFQNPFLSCWWKSARFKYSSASLIFSWSRLLERRFFNSLKNTLRECRSIDDKLNAQQNAESAKIHFNFHCRSKIFYSDSISIYNHTVRLIQNENNCIWDALYLKNSFFYLDHGFPSLTLNFGHWHFDGRLA